MAKRFLILAVGALALTACTSEDVVDDVQTSSRNVITFENVVEKPSRAAADLTTISLTQFNVFGFYTMQDEEKHAHKIFDNTPVRKQGGQWSYDGTVRYWAPGNTYYFYAYSCGSASVEEGISNQYGHFNIDMESGEKLASERTLQIDDYICDASHQHDLLFASKIGYTAVATNPAVAFSFKHILTKLQARFTNNFSGEYDVVIKEVTVDDICNKGDYNFVVSATTEAATSGWQDVTRTKNESTGQTDQPFVYLLNDAEDTPVTVKSQNHPEASTTYKDQLVGNTKYAYVIPKDYTSNSDEKVYLNLTVDLMLGNDYVIKDAQLRATINPHWQEGYSYVYNIELNPSAFDLKKIEFKVEEIKGWEPDTDVPTNIDNPTGNNN